MKELIEIIKKVSSETVIVLGGPEVSHEPFRVNYDLADFIIQGEGDLAFQTLCRQVDTDTAPDDKIIKQSMPNLAEIALPYEYYSNDDIKNRYTYVEASRGCPFECEFCLSSIDERVRYFDIDLLLETFETLWQRGVRNFKFIDRTFNLNMKFANVLLDFFLSKEPPYFAHFEVIPDHFPESIKQKMKAFPEGSLQLEIGIQTLNPEIADNISRPLKLEKIKKNIRFFEQETKVHLHLDLIVGLPGETLKSFGRNLDELCSISSSEIQIGILKKLSGTAMSRHDKIFGMVYSDVPPYDILQNDLLTFATIQQMKRFARFWDLVYNSGNFSQTSKLLRDDGKVFDGFFAFSEWIYEQTQSTWKISLDRLAKLLFDYLSEHKKRDLQVVAEAMVHDLMKIKGRSIPPYLKPFMSEQRVEGKQREGTGRKRQDGRA